MHGGDIYRNQVRMDFSVNINPMGVAPEVEHALRDAIEKSVCYPDITSSQLREQLGKRWQISPECVLCGNGASELLMAVCHGLKPRKALLLAPGFSGYAKALEAVSASVSYVYLSEENGFGLEDSFLEDVKRYRPDILLFSNPSNPIGVLRNREFIKQILDVCKECSTKILVDECFMELTENPQQSSVIPLLGNYPDLFILRAFTKSFAIPGIRLGYLLCADARMARQIEKQLPEWNVSVPAQQAGIAALHCDTYLEESRNLIARERRFLEEELREIGCKVYEGSANFILFQSTVKNIKEQLLTKGILIRDCRDYLGLQAGFYRIAVRTHEENRELLRELEACL